jgi:hypothetical protein
MMLDEDELRELRFRLGLLEAKVRDQRDCIAWLLAQVHVLREAVLVLTEDGARLPEPMGSGALWRLTNDEPVIYDDRNDE